MLAAKDFVSGVLRGGKGERREGGGSYYFTLRNNYCKVWGARDKRDNFYVVPKCYVFFSLCIPEMRKLLILQFGTNFIMLQGLSAHRI